MPRQIGRLFRKVRYPSLGGFSVIHPTPDDCRQVIEITRSNRLPRCRVQTPPPMFLQVHKDADGSPDPLRRCFDVAVGEMGIAQRHLHVC